MRLLQITRRCLGRTGLIDGVDLERIEHGSICFDLHTLSSTDDSVRIFREAF